MIHVQSAVCQHDLQKWNINLDTFIYPTISLFLLWSNSQLNIMDIYLYIQSRMVTVHAWSDSGQKCVGATMLHENATVIKRQRCEVCIDTILCVVNNHLTKSPTKVEGNSKAFSTLYYCHTVQPGRLISKLYNYTCYVIWTKWPEGPVAWIGRNEHLHNWIQYSR